MPRNTLQNIHYWILGLLMCFPLWHMKVSNILIAVFAIISIFSAFFLRERPRKESIIELLVYVSPFMLILFSVLFRQISNDSIFYLEKSLSLLVIPFCFFISPFSISKDGLNRVLSFFALSTLAITAYGLVSSAIRLHVYLEKGVVRSYYELTHHPAFSHYLRSYFEEATSFHPTYVSIFLGISFLILFQRLLSNYILVQKKVILVYLLGAFVSLVFLAILASRAPFAATMIGAFILFFANLKRKANIVFFGAGLAILSLVMYFFVPSFSSRFNEVSAENMDLPNAVNQNSFNIRTGIYKCSFEIIQENWLLGVGPGNLQQVLNTCYTNISKSVYDGHDYNTHNQYLDYWASMGIVGLFLLLFLLGWVIVMNVKKGNWLGVAITILFFIAFFTENILQRQYGIAVFALFISLFGFKNLQSQKKD